MDLPRDGLPRTVLPDRTLRVKILDHCGLACTFCHNEGTPVAADSPDRSGAVTSGRVSIYAHTNGVTFQPARIEPGPDFALALTAVRGTVATDEAHFTGGEPTLHPGCPRSSPMPGGWASRLASPPTARTAPPCCPPVRKPGWIG